ncbi:hypothetical protein D4764_06G0014110 [Takifugu flavidus]|uniref:Uncharacterized protein n=1 Tax=Takifugu flavidus TaxID=433684 RepID=A0A5C6N0S1_9TELE|nr:hypothetical protein D4764_06G0014110 [Takifugu flavidus]
MRISTSKSESMVLTRKKVECLLGSGRRTCLRVAGLSLRDRVRSSDIREELEVEPLLLRTCPTGRRPHGRPRTRWRDYISRLAWERLGRGLSGHPS